MILIFRFQILGSDPDFERSSIKKNQCSCVTVCPGSLVHFQIASHSIKNGGAFFDLQFLKHTESFFLTSWFESLKVLSFCFSRFFIWIIWMKSHLHCWKANCYDEVSTPVDKDRHGHGRRPRALWEQFRRYHPGYGAWAHREEDDVEQGGNYRQPPDPRY